MTESELGMEQMVKEGHISNCGPVRQRTTLRLYAAKSCNDIQLNTRNGIPLPFLDFKGFAQDGNNRPFKNPVCT
jgi:hypothetical protein